MQASRYLRRISKVWIESPAGRRLGSSPSRRKNASMVWLLLAAGCISLLVLVDMSRTCKLMESLYVSIVTSIMHLGVSEDWGRFIFWNTALVVELTAVVLVSWLLGDGSLRATCHRLGLMRIPLRSWLAGLSAGIAVLVGFLGLLIAAHARFWFIGCSAIDFRHVFNLLAGTALREEVIYRGFAFRLLRSRLHWIPAAVGSSAVFALTHIAPAIEAVKCGHGVAAAIAQVVFPFFVGLACCWMVERGGGSISGPVIAHFALNASNLVCREQIGVPAAWVGYFWLSKIMVDMAALALGILLSFPPVRSGVFHDFKGIDRGKSRRKT